MKTFAARMADGRAAKKAARDRGQGSGRQGMRAMTRQEREEIDAMPPPGHARAILELRMTWQHIQAEELADRMFRILNSEPGLMPEWI